jgi:hypothetical protein
MEVMKPELVATLRIQLAGMHVPAICFLSGPLGSEPTAGQISDSHPQHDANQFLQLPQRDPE